MKLNHQFLCALALACLVVTVGCTTIKQEARETGTNGVVRIVTMSIRTTGDAKAVVERLNASNGKTQSLGARGVEESSSSTNVNALVESVVSAAIKAAVKP